MTADRRLLALLVAANVLWAPVNLMIKTGTGGGFTPIGLAAVRWILLSFVLGLFLALPAFRSLSEAQFPTPPDAVKAVLLGLLLFGPTHAIYYTALQLTTSLEGNVLGTTAPIWVAILSFFLLGERPTPLRLAAIGLGIVGAIVVSIEFGKPILEGEHNGGNALYTLGVFTESIVGVGAAALVRRSSGITILWYQVIGAGLFYLVATPLCRFLSAQGTLVALPWDGRITNGPVTLSAIGALAYLVFVAGMFNFGVWYTIAKKAPLTWMTITLLLQPPVTAVLGWVVLRERPSPNVWVGTALILVALGIGMVRPRTDSGKLAAETT